MQIDNSAANMFRMCPWAYYEAYLRNGNGVQPIPIKGESYGPLELGGRVHELQEFHYKGLGILQGKPWELPKYNLPENEKLEDEARWMMDAYIAAHPNDNWEIIDVERTFRVQLPSNCPKCGGEGHEKMSSYRKLVCDNCGEMFVTHIYCGKIDLFIRDRADGKYWIIDHKTEKRGSKSHIPQKLAVSDQGSLYLWAAKKVYPQVDGMKYNILTRPSTAGREGPSFPERYQIERGEHEIDVAVRDITIIADHITDYTARFHDGEWPANREECYGWGYCDYYLLHRYGEDPTEILKHKFQAREEYLALDGVEVIK